jgi:hypothetical protein
MALRPKDLEGSLSILGEKGSNIRRGCRGQACARGVDLLRGRLRLVGEFRGPPRSFARVFCPIISETELAMTKENRRVKVEIAGFAVIRSGMGLS